MSRFRFAFSSIIYFLRRNDYWENISFQLKSLKTDASISKSELRGTFLPGSFRHVSLSPCRARLDLKIFRDFDRLWGRGEGLGASAAPIRVFLFDLLPQIFHRMSPPFPELVSIKSKYFFKFFYWSNNKQWPRENILAEEGVQDLRWSFPFEFTFLYKSSNSPAWSLFM